MKLELDLDLSDIEADKAEGQVNIKMPRDLEMRFKLLNVRYNKKLSKVMRRLALQLVEQFEALDHAS